MAVHVDVEVCGQPHSQSIACGMVARGASAFLPSVRRGVDSESLAVDFTVFCVEVTIPLLCTPGQ